VHVNTIMHSVSSHFQDFLPTLVKEYGKLLLLLNRHMTTNKTIDMCVTFSVDNREYANCTQSGCCLNHVECF
jgi:hypothetical protein